MALERKRELARMCAELTEDLPGKLGQLGGYMVARMERANCGDADEARRAECAILGMTEALTILGIPVRKANREPDGQYTYVEIGGQSFSVKTCDTD
ncbi:MAG: hypothetical protein IJQ25_05335 [Oscillibacter sp.]|nr:hypothetical protein [Oscillibacter sp.]